MLEVAESYSTGELVRRAQAGDRESFGQLCERFQSTVMAVALGRVRNLAEAEEVCQEVFIRAMLRLEQLREAEAFAGWLRSIAVRVAINRASRRRLVSGSALVVDDLLAGDEDSGEDRLLTEERRAEVQAGLARLGQLDRETLQAFYFDDLSLLEMAEAFRAPVGTIKRRLHVARHRLAEQLQSTVSV
ncbi:MAG: RNA polymerase sigma factor [Planctomycetota bacterium]